MKKLGQIPTLGCSNKISDVDKKNLLDLTEPALIQTGAMDQIREHIFEEARKNLDAFYKALDTQAFIVRDRAIANGEIKGKPTKAKFSKAGYDVCHHEGVGSYIRKNGVRVSEIIVMDTI